MRKRNRKVEVSDISNKMGRPTDNPKTLRMEIRLTPDESGLLKYCAEQLNLTRTQVVVKGVELVKQQIERVT